MAKKNQQPSAQLTPAGIFPISASWGEFCSLWKDWLEQMGFPEPIYCMNEECIAVLERPLPHGDAIIDPTSAKAERHLSMICRRSFAIGFWHGNHVNYPLLSARPSQTALEYWIQKCFPELKGIALALAKVTDDTGAPRLAGVAGWLCTDPGYLEELRVLEEAWSRLPSRERPSFPLRRTCELPVSPGLARRASDATRQFAESLGAFLDRWELMYLATWDLPYPQGPLLPNPLPAGSPAMPTQGVHTIVPVHYPHQYDDELQRGIKRQQQALATDKGLDQSLAGLPHHAAYAQMLQVVHIEKIIRQRYGRGRTRRGFITRLEEAIAADVKCGSYNIKKLRKGISCCLRGKRNSVSWLRPPVR